MADAPRAERTAHLDHVVAARPEVRDDVAADESGGAGDGDPHHAQRLLVDAIGLVAARAGELGRLIDVAIVLEHPRELRPPVRVRLQLPVQLEEEQGIEAEPSIGR